MIPEVVILVNAKLLVAAAFACAIFIGLYLVAMAFVLALQNRAFTEIGAGGMRARSLADLPMTLRTHERALGGLLEVLDEIWHLRDDPREE